MGFFDMIKELNKKNEEHKQKYREKRNKKTKVFVQLHHLEGLPNIEKGQRTSIELNPKENKLYMGKLLLGKQKENAIVLDMDKFEYVKNITVTEVYEKDKSVVGRAMIGHLLDDSDGAVVGGMSGIGTKKKTKTKKKLIIGYKSNGEEKQIMFSSKKENWEYKTLHDELKKYEPQKPEGEKKTGQIEL
ncbi:hypothetical protein [Senegalia massiliensis]|uniref:Uncharacterized protein n=1 Tax=Senegalia massiliensis TaxID=1720316 RepID=A0A845R029_9CLOT|nr:hypothetical protein [Senegalia massiliensis]NBI08075.1 hypothetical protein [Senegalia massiliensis]